MSAAPDLPTPSSYAIATGARLSVLEFGDPTAQPLVLVCGTTQGMGMWAPLAEALGASHRVICFDHAGMGDSQPGEGALSMASMAADLDALLDALGVERAHVLGWSLGSAVAQELALRRPERVDGLVLYGTWGRCDGFQKAVLAGLRHPWATGDVEIALTALGIAFSPELLASPDFPALMEQMLPFFPQTEGQVRTTVAQWDADLAHDTLDRVEKIQARTLVLAGEQDLLTPPWLGEAVARRIPGARYELLTGAGSSHALAFERTEEFLGLVLGFLAEA